MKHSLLIKHDGIDHDIVIRILKMVLPNQSTFIKNSQEVVHDLNIYQFGEDRTVISYNDELKDALEGIQNDLIESGIESEYIKIEQEANHQQILKF
ncbi:hypothetical protein E3U55_15100 [Filobacillus milosensis]|uniref:Uncharacterized protein n=1 Tax=Filobacillus milosensis TaxID=94137 RepID=A0A4Y8IJZ2_9BACI|nr:hypothetical protein [Filobacillus milosensis]TFB13889.1 hypothetical protein E3U55_15100 [Filobacillus milosensis]